MNIIFYVIDKYLWTRRITRSKINNSSNYLIYGSSIIRLYYYIGFFIVNVKITKFGSITSYNFITDLSKIWIKNFDSQICISSIIIYNNNLSRTWYFYYCIFISSCRCSCCDIFLRSSFNSFFLYDLHGFTN